MSDTTTQGIRIQVQAEYSPERSQPASSLFFFVYTVRISNEGKQTAQLKSRHWIITDGNQHMEEVRGPGVVGDTPVLRPGQSYTYSSGCMLRTQFGTMRGSYQMVRPNDEEFDAEIAPFMLALPHAVN